MPAILEIRPLFYAVLALFIAPIWIVDYPPFVDLPQHMAQVNALGLILSGDPTFSEAFEINWFTPYFLPYILLFALDVVLPIAWATKLLLSVAVISVPLVTGALLREVGGDPRLRWLAIPGAFSFALYWGFLSFLVSVPLGLGLLLVTVRYARSPSMPLALGIVALGVTLFFSHVLALGVSAAMSLAYLVGIHYRTPMRLLRLAIPYTAPLPLIAIWLARTTEREAYVQDAGVYFGPWLGRWIEALAAPTGIDLIVPTATIVGGLTFFALPAILGCRLTRDPARWLVMLCAFTIFLVFPAVAFNTGFLYVRFGIFLLPSWLLLWEAPKNASLRFSLFPLLVVVSVGVINVLRFHAFNAETVHYERVSEQIPEGARLLTVGHGYQSPKFRAPAFLHFGAYHQALHDGIADFNFGFFYPQLVRYKAEMLPPFSDGFVWRPLSLDWDAYRGESYDYFLIFEQRDISEPLFGDQRGAVDLVDRQGRWWLYRNRSRTVAIQSDD